MAILTGYVGRIDIFVDEDVKFDIYMSDAYSDPNQVFDGFLHNQDEIIERLVLNSRKFGDLEAEDCITAFHGLVTESRNEITFPNSREYVFEDIQIEIFPMFFHDVSEVIHSKGDQ